MSQVTTPKGLAEYRALDKAAKAAYDPSRKAGADTVRHLQKLAKLMASAKSEGENIARNRNNTEFPEWKKTNDALRDLFRAVGYGMPNLARDAQRMHLIPLSAQDAEIARHAAKAAHPRRSNWGDSRPCIKACAAGETINEAFAYAGKFKGRTGYTYHPAMQSAARISNDCTMLTALIGYKSTAITIQAGRGYQWGADANGVRLVRLADCADYHPDSDEIRAGRSAIIAKLSERAETRKKTAAAAKRDAKIIAEACKHGVWVCFADSIDGGNCSTGTKAFVRRHGLNIQRHYRAETLPKGAESGRIALAVLAAQRRQVRDMQRGYAEI